MSFFDKFVSACFCSWILIAEEYSPVPRWPNGEIQAGSRFCPRFWTVTSIVESPWRIRAYATCIIVCVYCQFDRLKVGIGYKEDLSSVATNILKKQQKKTHKIMGIDSHINSNCDLRTTSNTGPIFIFINKQFPSTPNQSVWNYSEQFWFLYRENIKEMANLQESEIL